MSGEYHITIDATEKNALAHTPLAPQAPPTGASSMRDEFAPLELLSNWAKPPAIKYTDLQAMVTTNVRYNTLPMRVRTDFVPVTPASIYANITLQFESKDLQFMEKDGLSKATVNLYGRITTMSRRTVKVFEDVVCLEGPSQLSAIYQKTLPLAPGRYRLNIAAKDVTGGNTTTNEAALDVPQFDEDQLAASSLILADLMEPVPARSIGVGQFVIGDTKVRPRVTATFRNDEKLGIYVQLYHLSNGDMEYHITRDGTNEAVLNYTEAANPVVEKWLSLRDLAPGSYTLRLKVTDHNSGQTITPSAQFTIIQ